MTRAYKRRVKTMLFAAMHVLDGKGIGPYQPRCTHAECLKFLHRELPAVFRLPRVDG